MCGGGATSPHALCVGKITHALRVNQGPKRFGKTGAGDSDRSLKPTKINRAKNLKTFFDNSYMRMLLHLTVFISEYQPTLNKIFETHKK